MKQLLAFEKADMGKSSFRLLLLSWFLNLVSPWLILLFGKLFSKIIYLYFISNTNNYFISKIY